VVDYGDGHIVLDAQQQMAFQEQMRHADMLEWKPRKVRHPRNPLLAEETSRSVLEFRTSREVVRKPPEKRVLLGGTFMLKKDLCTERRDDIERRTVLMEANQKEQDERLREHKAAVKEEERRRREEAAGNYSNQNDSARGSARLETARSRLEATQRAMRAGLEEELREEYGAEEEDRTAAGFVSGRSIGRTPRPQSAAVVRSGRGPEIDDDRVESCVRARSERACERSERACERSERACE
jgi:hypothetical protein